MPDKRITLMLFFIEGRLNDNDLTFIKKFHQVVPIVPILGKADQLLE